jgi:hypothetical protein
MKQALAGVADLERAADLTARLVADRLPAS